MPAMQEQLPAMAMDRMASMPCGFTEGMAGMPAMQEQLPAMALDGWLPSTQEPLQAAFRLANRPVPKVILVEYGSRCYADA